MNAKAEADKTWAETSSGSQHGRTHAAQGINVGMRYVKDKDSVMIDGTRASAIRKAAHLIWVHISLNNPRGPPPTWGKADVNMVQGYHSEMCQQFPELKLCESNWKANQIATDNYPSWYCGWSETQSWKSVNDVMPGVTVPNLKRSAKASCKPAAKRSRLQSSCIAPATDLGIHKVERNPYSAVIPAQ